MGEAGCSPIGFSTTASVRMASLRLSRFARPLVCLGLAVGLAFVLLACGRDGPPVERETFSRVLVELHLIRARSVVLDTIPPSLRDSVFARYGVEERGFEETLSYYARRPNELESIYDGVIDTLSALQGRLQRGDNPPSGIDTLTTPDP